MSPPPVPPGIGRPRGHLVAARATPAAGGLAFRAPTHRAPERQPLVGMMMHHDDYRNKNRDY